MEIILLLVCAAITAYFAKSRGRSPVAWFLIGFFAGLLGLIALFVLPKVENSKLSQNGNV